MSITSTPRTAIRTARPFGLGIAADPIAETLAAAEIVRVAEGREAGTYVRSTGGWMDATGRGLRAADADHLYRLGRLTIEPTSPRDRVAEDAAFQLGHEVGKAGGNGRATAGSPARVELAFTAGLAEGRKRFAAEERARIEAERIADEALERAEEAWEISEWQGSALAAAYAG